MTSLTNPEVTEKIRQLLSGPGAIDIGQMEFVNLDEVRAICGENWGHWRDRIFIAAEGIIRKQVSSKDLVIQCGNGFIVIFAEQAERDVEAIGEKIARKTREFFLGAEEFSHLELKMETARVTANEFAQRLARSKPEAFPTVDRAHPDDRLQEKGSAEPPSVLGGSAPKVAIVFAPVWSAQAQAVGTFLCIPRRLFRDGGYRYGPDVMPKDARPEDRLSLDVHVFRRAREAMQDLAGRRMKLAISVSVSYRVLATARTRVRFLEELQALDPDMRQRLLLRIDGAPVDAPPAQLTEVTRIMSRFCGQIMMELPINALDLTRYSQAQIDVVGLRLPDKTDGIYANRDQFDRHAEDARKRGRMIYLANCRQASIVGEGLASGFGYFAGPAIGLPLEMPSAPYRLSWEEVRKASPRFDGPR